MQTSMTLGSVAALFAAMAVLAALPSVSVLAVSARAAASGFLHGAVTSIGVVAGDLLFIVLALFGLAFLAETLGSHFVWLSYLGAAYLIVLGLSLWRSRHGGDGRGKHAVAAASLSSSFMTGLLITLADQKAVLFYLGFLPAFIDLSRVSWLDAAIIAATTIVAVGGVKLVYAGLASRTGALLGSKAGKWLNIVAGTVMIGTGACLLLKA